MQHPTLFALGFLVLTVSLPSPAHAEIYNTWKGDLTYESVAGDRTHVQGFQIQISRVDNTLQFADDGGWTLLPGNLDIHGDQLFLHGARVGTLSDYGLQLSLLGQLSGHDYVVELVVENNGTLTYRDSVQYYDGTTDSLAGNCNAGNTPNGAITKTHSPAQIEAAFLRRNQYGNLN